jgi:hypothetical protein
MLEEEVLAQALLLFWALVVLAGVDQAVQTLVMVFQELQILVAAAVHLAQGTGER